MSKTSNRNTALVKRDVSTRLVAANKQREQQASYTYTVLDIDDAKLSSSVPWDGLKGPSKWTRTEIIHRYEYMHANAHAHIGTPARQDETQAVSAGKKSKQSKRQNKASLINRVGWLMIKTAAYGFLLMVLIKMMEG